MAAVWVRYHGYSLSSDDCYPTGTDRPKREGTRAYARVVDRRLIDERVSSTALPALFRSLTIPVSLSPRSITVSLSLSSTLHRSPTSHPHPDPVSNAAARDVSRIFLTSGPVVWTPSQLRAQSHGYGLRGRSVQLLLLLSQSQLQSSSSSLFLFDKRAL